MRTPIYSFRIEELRSEQNPFSQSDLSDMTYGLYEAGLSSLTHVMILFASCLTWHATSFAMWHQKRAL
ncbi:hypothetical protein RDI58_014800 [Solanum bulbocastanum]|uniref:Uncharacterized protein n=1 Tax=Solanum bulbocastanum TaxID=147425 RepID=A0AAN8TEB6_SOLBU